MSKTQPLPALTSDFAHATRDDWMVLVDKALKGSDFTRRLVTTTYDGGRIQPIYDRALVGRTPHHPQVTRPWGINVRVDHPHAEAAAALALAELDGGADGLTLVLAGAATARGFGLQVGSVADLDAALAGVMLELITLRLDSGITASRDAALVAALVAHRGHAPAALQINFGLDPIGMIARDGGTASHWNDVGRDLSAVVEQLRGAGFGGPFINCDLRPFSEAGASEAQELAAALASGVAYARTLVANGMAVADAYGALSWTMPIDADQFMGIAKLRALRQLWDRVDSASGGHGAAITVHAETAWRMLTTRDPAVNMLRATSAAFVAAIGGADSLTILPHTSARGLPDELSRRIARNAQLVLQEESHLWRVTDPASGSGAIEALTEQLCVTAWRYFQEIESEGGLVESLKAGLIQGRIATVAEQRRNDIACRKAQITGVSEFPNLAEDYGGVLAISPHASASDAITTRRGGAWQPLISQRLAAPFEQLRDAADRATAGSGQRPVVFLANLGDLAEFGARASWMTNLLASGGLTTVTNDGFSASSAAAAAFAASGAQCACICGSDATYALLGEATAMALQAAGAKHVMLAGKPGTQEKELTAAGVAQFIFAGQDIIAALRNIHRQLGLSVS